MAAIDGSSTYAQPKKKKPTTSRPEGIKKKKKRRPKARPKRGSTSVPLQRTGPVATRPRAGVGSQQPRVTFKLPPNHGHIMQTERRNRELQSRIERMVDPRAIAAGEFALASRRQIRAREQTYAQEQQRLAERNRNRDAVRLDPDVLRAELRRQQALEESRRLQDTLQRGEDARNKRRGDNP
jgi:hypothetical protein